MNRRTRGSRWEAVRATVTGSLWPIPTMAVTAAVGLGIGLTELDQALAYGDNPVTFVFTGGPSAARTVLSAIASSLISVTTLLFSLTIVTLQLASSQYSPRLLQTFVRDRVVQVCLGVLLGTFVYALAVLRTVRSADEAQGLSFVPRISVTVAFVLALASVAALVVFLSHQTRQLRVETMMRDVHTEASPTVRRIDGELAEDDQPDEDLPPVPPRARPVCARDSGFYVQLAEAPLLEALADSGASLQLAVRPGDPVIEGTPVGWAWTDAPGTEVPVEDVEAALRRHLTLEYERYDLGDPSYGLRKLVDIAARALSPGINDPTTAVHALSHVSALLGQATARDTRNRRVSDESGRERLQVASWDFEALLDLAVTQPRLYGSEDPTVVVRLFSLLAEVAWRTRTPRQRAAVLAQRDALVGRCEPDPPTGRTAEDVRRWAGAVDAALAGRWEPLLGH
ncbi:DUF2254 domain-containing protein [Geodermatophilus sp. SYSU D00758]